MVFDGQKFTGRAPAQFNSGTNSERKKEERNKTVEKMKAACPRRGSSRQGFFSGIEYRDVTPPGPLTSSSPWLAVHFIYRLGRRESYSRYTSLPPKNNLY